MRKALQRAGLKLPSSLVSMVCAFILLKVSAPSCILQKERTPCWSEVQGTVSVLRVALYSYVDDPYTPVHASSCDNDEGTSRIVAGTREASLHTGGPGSEMRLLLRGTIVNMTYGTHTNLYNSLFLPLYIWSYLRLSPVVGGRDLRRAKTMNGKKKIRE